MERANSAASGAAGIKAVRRIVGRMNQSVHLRRLIEVDQRNVAEVLKLWDQFDSGLETTANAFLDLCVVFNDEVSRHQEGPATEAQFQNAAESLGLSDDALLQRLYAEESGNAEAAELPLPEGIISLSLGLSIVPGTAVGFWCSFPSALYGTR